MKNFYFSLFLLLFTTAVTAQVSVTATAGTTGPTSYTNLKGAFDAINLGTHQGAVTVSINANTTEAATASLNASGSGAASYTSVMIKPGAASSPTVSGSISSGPVVKLNGSSNVTIDGSNSGGTSRDLTITNTSATSSNVLQAGSVGTTPISNVTLKNTVFINGTNTSTCLLLGDAAVIGSPGYFSNITIQNNSIQKAYIGIYMYATVSALNNNTVVTGNDINATGTNSIRLVGIYGQGVDGLTISNNNVGNFETASAEFDRAIWLATATKNAVISGNTISGLAYSGTSSYAPIGINVSPGITNSNISVTGNTVSGLTSSGTGTTMGMFVYSAASGITISKNKVSNIKNTNTGGYGSAGIITALTINSGATKINNNFIWDVASYGFNGYGSGDNGNGIVIDGGGGYDVDYNTVVLNTNQTLTGAHRASCMLITANVTASAAVNMRNNIFANTQTVGNANSRLAISVLATTGSGVFASDNYNDYYSAGGNLSSTGTNASITTTLAGLQASIGGNANSLNVQPVFVSATDMHMSTAPGDNACLDGRGVVVAGITTDIDGQTRSAGVAPAGPDMGADEFTSVAVTATPASQSICSGSAITTITYNGSAGTTYSWVRDNTVSVTGIAANGTSTISGSLTNTTASDVTVTFTVTPLLNGCTGVPFTATVLVKAGAVVTPSSVQPTTCVSADGSINLTLSGAAGPYSFAWTGTGVNPTAQNQTGLTVGTYSVVVTAGNLCTASATITLTGPGGCTACPTIPTLTSNPTPATCIGSTIALTASGLTQMGVTYGIIFKYSATPLANPYSGGTVISTVPNGSLTAGGTQAAASTSFAAAGTYNIYAILTPNPLDPTCRPSATTTVTINPTPTVNAVTNQTVCNSGSTTAITFSGAVAGTVYNWTNNNTSIGLAASGSGNIASFTATNAGTAPVTATITVTPSYTNGGATCTGTPTTFTITVNPTATVNTVTNQTVCNNTSTTAVTFSSPTTGGTIVYNWTNNTTSIGLAASGSGNIAAFTAVNTTTSPVTATITVTPSYTNGSVTCTGTPRTFTITVNPTPAATISYAGSPYCSSAGTATVTATGTTGGTFTSTAGLSINASTGAITLGTSTPGTYTVTYTIAAAGGCAAFSTTASITITAAFNATISYAGSPYCINGGTANVTRTGTAGGTYSSTTGLVIDPATGDINLNTSTAGTYTVTYSIAASGGCSAFSTTASVTINTLSVAPTGATASNPVICTGSGVTNLSVVGGTLGTGASFKWYTGSCGGTLIGTGATLTNVAVFANTTFYVRAEGACNNTTCATVSVSVNPAPVAVLTAVPSNLTPSIPSTLTVTVSPPGNYLYTYIKNGVTVISNSTSTSIPLNTDSAGVYQVSVSNVSTGCSTMSNQVTIGGLRNEDVFISPNPNRGQFTVRYYADPSSYGKERGVSVFDEKGSRVFFKKVTITGPYTSMSVDISQHAAGIYHVLVTDAGGKNLGAQRVLVTP